MKRTIGLAAWTCIPALCLLVGSGCPLPRPDDDCAGEGEAIPGIPNAPECCPGLELIPSIDGAPGILGYCTEFCGDGVCDTTIESHYNCPEDCVE